MVEIKEIVKQGSKNSILFWVLVFLLVLIIGGGIWLALGAFFNAGTSISNQPAITVSGEGIIRAKPDVAILSVGIVTEADTVGNAQTQNNTIADKVKAAIIAQGVVEADISTSRYNIYPVGTPYPVPAPLSVTGSEGSVAPVAPEITAIAGQINRVENYLEIKVRKVDTVGKVIDAATGAGATNIESIYFSVENKDTLLAQARNLAGTAAKTKADQLAKSMNVSLGRLLSVDESSYYPGPIMYAAEAVKTSGAGTTISTGTLDITVNITARYEIR